MVRRTTAVVARAYQTSVSFPSRSGVKLEALKMGIKMKGRQCVVLNTSVEQIG